MAEISRCAGVGTATLYRNFPGRRELLEALYTDEVDAICEAAESVDAGTPGAVLMADGLPAAVRLPSGSGDAADRRLAGAARREPARVAEVCARYPVLSDRQMRAGRSVSPSNSNPCCRRSFVVSGRGLMSHFSFWSLALLRIARPEQTASPPRS
jgi:AcrR family transcriptional regulator